MLPESMLVARLETVGQVALTSIPVPAPSPEQILVRTRATTICTSDLADIQSNPFGLDLPVVIGHEAAGDVVSVGSAVSGFTVGDRVTAHPVHPCRVCPDCRRGLGHLCSYMSHFGIDLQGTFAEYFLVREDRARKLPAAVNYAVGALAEPVCVAMEAVERARLSASDSVLIIGDGPFGIMMARIASAIAGVRVVIAGRHDFRLRLARPAIQINTRKSRLEVGQAIALSGNDGFDAVILAVADPAAVDLGLCSLRARGRLVIFAPIMGQTPIELARILIKELEIIGAVNDPDLFDAAVARLADPGFRAQELVTHRFRLREVERALEVAANGHGRAVKVALTFD